MEKHAPFKKIFLMEKTTKRLEKTWFDHDSKNLLAKRQLAYEKNSQNASADNWSAFSRSRLKLANVIKLEQESFSRKCFSSFGAAKDRWNIFDSVRGSNHHSGNRTTVRNSFGHLIVDNKKNCQSFTYVFSTLGYYFGKLIEEAPLFTVCNASFCFWAVSEEYCFDIIRNLNHNKPTGPCKVLAWAITDGKQILVPHLTMILNECIKNCSFPAQLKRAAITPIYKKRWCSRYNKLSSHLSYYIILENPRADITLTNNNVCWK